VSDLVKKKEQLLKEIEQDRAKTNLKVLEHRELELMIELETIQGRIQDIKEHLEGG
jgi:hypothetical protein